MIVRTKEGWMKYKNSVIETIRQVANSNDDFDGVFHTNHIAQVLEAEGATITDDRDVRGRAVIGKGMIRAALNDYCRTYNPKIEKESLDWYRVIR